MGKDSSNSGIPVFVEVNKLLNRQEINTIAEELKIDMYSKRLDSYQHLVIMLYAVLGQFNLLRQVGLEFMSLAAYVNLFGCSHTIPKSSPT